MIYIFTLLYSFLLIMSIFHEKWIYYFLGIHYLNSSLIGMVVFISVGGIQLTANDFLCVAFILYPIMNHKLRIKGNLINYFVLFFFFYVIAQLSLGFFRFGITARWIGCVRIWIAIFFAFIRFGMIPNLFNLQVAKKVADLVFGFMGLYCAVYFIFAYGAGIALGGNTEMYRPVSSINALCICFYTLYILQKDLFSPAAKIGKKSMLFIIVTILCRHNSVWVALIAGLVAMIFFRFKILCKSKIFLLQIITIFLGTIALFVFFKDTSLVSGLIASNSKFDVDNAEYGTLSTRLQVWESSLKSFNGIEYLFGQGMGATSRIIYHGEVWEKSAHSAYMDGLAQLGIAGMLLLFIPIIYSLVRAIKIKFVVVVADIAALLFYWISYGFAIEQAVVLGCIFAVINNNCNENGLDHKALHIRFRWS